MPNVYKCEGYPKGSCSYPPPVTNYKIKLGGKEYCLCVGCWADMVQQENINVPCEPINFSWEHLQW